MVFALYFGNRGFFPGDLQAAARRELIAAVKKAGHESIVMDEAATKFGAVETVSDGEKYAKFLRENADKIDGAILSLPNFGDENGAAEAFGEFNKPILIQAYPDEIGKMDFERRRDAYCGKLSIMDVFMQFGIKFTAWQPHVVSPSDPAFIKQIREFGKVCAVVKGMRKLRITAVGARCTAFKTVRFDELTAQKFGVTVDTIDLSDLFARMDALGETESVVSLAEALSCYADYSRIPKAKVMETARTVLGLRQIADEYKSGAMSLRCWNEFSTVRGICPCSAVSFMNQNGIPCACELDTGSALIMKALSLAADQPAACLDWNNNYGTEKDKCILFHCGPVAASLMETKGEIKEHKMFVKTYGDGCAYGTNEGRLKKGGFTYSSAKTSDGQIAVYLGKGNITGQPIEKEYFGLAGVAEIAGLENVLSYIGKNGYRHHVCLSYGDHINAVSEALGNYLGYSVKTLEF